MRRTDTLIVGGGPAGAAAAIAMAGRGARPLLLERQREPQDALCGGFMSWRTLESLAALGVAPDRLGGQAIDEVALFSGARCVRARLPGTGMGLSRLRLDIALLEAAAQAGASIERGVAVAAADRSGEVRLADGGAVCTDALFLATGKHELRGLKRDADRPGDSWMGLRFRLPASHELRDGVGRAIELHLVEGGYAGLVLQEDGSGNLCMALRRSRLAAAGGDPAALLAMLAEEAPMLADRLTRTDTPPTADAIGLVPYGWRAQAGTPGLFRLGDQAAVIPSLAGEGIGIAMASGISAAAAWRAGGPPAAVHWQRDFALQVRRPVAIAGWLKALAEKPGRARFTLPLARIPGLLRLLAGSTRIA